MKLLEIILMAQAIFGCRARIDGIFIRNQSIMQFLAFIWRSLRQIETTSRTLSISYR
jgi:hypothetical protein